MLIDNLERKRENIGEYHKNQGLTINQKNKYT